MGIQVEFNPDLALRAHDMVGRLEDECLPALLEAGKTYPFLKKGQRNYWIFDETPLLQTDGKGNLSSPLASVLIIEPTHILRDGEVWTRGIYKVIEVYDIRDAKIHFEGFKKHGA